MPHDCPLSGSLPLGELKLYQRLPGSPSLINLIRIVALLHASQHPNSPESVLSTFWGTEDLNTETDLMS